MPSKPKAKPPCLKIRTHIKAGDYTITAPDSSTLCQDEQGFLRYCK